MGNEKELSTVINKTKTAPNYPPALLEHTKSTASNQSTTKSLPPADKKRKLKINFDKKRKRRKFESESDSDDEIPIAKRIVKKRGKVKIKFMKSLPDDSKSNERLTNKKLFSRLKT